MLYSDMAVFEPDGFVTTVGNHLFAVFTKLWIHV